MSDIAIRVADLGKQYRLGSQERYKALRDTLGDALNAPARFLRVRPPKAEPASRTTPTIWALNRLSFEVKRGEVLGVIGHNGAGKSTLLKVLSRITEPTRGAVDIYGRVGSLLEVGTGFHPELTGRENVFLNGAILGMGRSEIVRRFDEIVAFAEIEAFLDTPVKHYSTGMYMRLAFSVAAHLDTEILVVDEVLAVGDSAFQKKCLDKIGSVTDEGRTTLFVSHNMAAIQSLCTRAILLERGELITDGLPTQAINAYINGLGGASTPGAVDLTDHPQRRPSSVRILSSVSLTNNSGVPVTSIFPGDDVILDFLLSPPARMTGPTLAVGIDNTLGARIFSVATYFASTEWGSMEGPTRVRCRIPHVKLTPGRYFMSLSVGNLYTPLADAIDHAMSFDVEACDFFGSGRLPTPDLGVVLAESHWDVGLPPGGSALEATHA